jgi:hypothetical protein
MELITRNVNRGAKLFEGEKDYYLEGPWDVGSVLFFYLHGDYRTFICFVSIPEDKYLLKYIFYMYCIFYNWNG